MNQENLETTESKRTLLAQRLREARDYAGLSQDDVSSALGVSRPAVANIEAGKRKVEAVELEKLSTLYGRTVDYLLNGATREDDSRVAFLARATHGLTESDFEEIARFAAFLRNSPRQRNKDDS